MIYITGMHALTTECRLGTSGSSKIYSVSWDDIDIRESDDSLLGDEGIERDVYIPPIEEVFNKADHIRAIADLLDSGRYALAATMREDYLDGDLSFCRTLFNMVWRLRAVKSDFEWSGISKVMEKEYMLHWLAYLGRKGIGTVRRKVVLDKKFTDDECRRLVENSRGISRLLNEYAIDGKLEDLYTLLWLVDNYRESIDDSRISQIEIIFFYRHLEYCDYLLATSDITGAEPDEIREMFIRVLDKVGLFVVDPVPPLDNLV